MTFCTAIAFGQGTSSTILTVPSNPATLGQPVIIRASVTPGATGKVTFYDGVTFLGVASLSGSQASFVAYDLAAGDHSFRARYSGDANYQPSVSASAPKRVRAIPANRMRAGATFRASHLGQPIAAADLNHDGKLDLVTVTSYGPDVLLGNGNGSFDLPTAVTVPAAALPIENVVTGDFNGDGNTDVATFGPFGSYLLLGNGDATFRDAVRILTTSDGSPVAADLNGDGYLDLALVFGGHIRVLLGNGNGTFQPPSTVADGAAGWSALLLADLNNDGRADLVALDASSNGGLGVFLGHGDGTFETPRIYSDSRLLYPSSFVAGDFDGDGKPDIAVIGPAIVVFAGNGDGTVRVSGFSLQDQSAGKSAIAGDFNGDGKLDIAFTDRASGGFYLELGNGDGTFGTGGRFSSAAGGSSGLVTADLNGDGRPDLAASLAFDGVQIFLGEHDSCTPANPSCTQPDTLAGMAAAPAISMNTVRSAPRILSATTTSLALSPVASTLGQLVTATASVTAGSTGTVEFFDNGVFIGSAIVSSSQAIFSTRLFPAGVRTVTANYSGDLTHAPSSSAAKSLTVTPGPANSVNAGNIYATGASPTAIAAGDFNGDGKTDLVTANAAGGTISVLLGIGNGTFHPKVDYTVGTTPSSVAIGDFNNDGKPDLAVVNVGSRSVSILLGNGDGTFQAAVNQSYSADGPTFVTVGDLNNDGNADLMLGSAIGGTVLLGNGNGTFTRLGSPGTQSGFLALGDLNGDGIVDVISGSSGVAVLGNGDGTFGAAHLWGAFGSTGIAVGDLNGDGKLDVVQSGNNGGTGVVTVCLGKGDGATFGCVAYPAGNSPQGVIITDVNGDGKLDVVAVNTSNNALAVLLGNGDGTLQSFVVDFVGAPAAVVAGEFNGDGKTDFAVTSVEKSTVTILPGVLLPQLQVSSSHNGSFAPGQSGAVYVLTVKNLGPPTTSGTVTLIDTLPPSLTATAIGGAGWSCSLGTLTCTRSDALAPSASYPPVTLTVNVSPTAPASLYNFVNVIGTGMLGGNGADFTLITTNPPVFSLSKTHTGNFAQGQGGALYTVTVSNAPGAGPSAGTVTVTDTLPAGLTLASMSGTGWSCSANVCTRSDSLAPGASYPPIVVNVNVAWTAGSSLPNSVLVTGGGSLNASAVDVTTIGPAQGLRFVPVAPCRVVDTRLAAGPFGGPGLAGGTSRSFVVPSSACSIPPTALAYSLNLAVVPAGPLGYVTLWPTGQTQPLVSTVNSLDGRTKSNAAIVPAGTAGAISVFASNATQIVLDINGYFLPNTDPNALSFYPVAPCRIADTRNPAAPLGGPFLTGGVPRTFPILSSACNIPPTAQAYSLNFAAVPKGPLGYLTAWPTGTSQPLVASLNAITGVVTSNAAIVPAGAGGDIDIFASNSTDLVIDINGYFAPPGAGGLSLYNIVPCRVLDTRLPPGSPAFSGALDVTVAGGACGTPGTARAYVLSATVVPSGPLGYLSLWAQGQPQPTVATLNAVDAAVTSNLAIVSTNNGMISAFASNPTHLVMDLNGFFAP